MTFNPDLVATWVGPGIVVLAAIVAIVGAIWRGKIPNQALGILVAGLVLAVIVGGTLYYVLRTHGAGFGEVAAFVLVGLAAFLGIMNVLSFSAGMLDIADARQPFGLPEGSVRAILTMAFIVLVGVLASYLVTNTGNRSVFAEPILLARGVQLGAAQDIGKGFPAADGAIFIVPSSSSKAESAPTAPPANATPQPSSPANASPPSSPPANAGQPSAAPSRNNLPSGRSVKTARPPQPPPPTPPSSASSAVFDVKLYPRADYRLADDVSKQILTMLSTILAAMIGFYFGARPGESDPAATKRALAVANIERLIATAPSADELGTRCDTLLKGKLSAAGKEAARKEVADFKTELAQLKNSFADAGAARLSIATTADQMQAAADKAKAVVDRLREIDKRLEELEKS